MLSIVYIWIGGLDLNRGGYKYYNPVLFPKRFLLSSDDDRSKVPEWVLSGKL